MFFSEFSGRGEQSGRLPAGKLEAEAAPGVLTENRATAASRRIPNLISKPCPQPPSVCRRIFRTQFESYSLPESILPRVFGVGHGPARASADPWSASSTAARRISLPPSDLDRRTALRSWPQGLKWPAFRWQRRGLSQSRVFQVRVSCVVRPSRNARSLRLRDGCRSLRNALASI
jgi:hypothetical protein